MKMKTFKLITVGLLAATTLFSCQNEDAASDLAPVPENTTQTVPEVDNSSIPADIIQKLSDRGFDTDQQIIKDEDGYIVEGDILVEPINLIDDIIGPDTEGSIEKQYRDRQLVRCSRVRNIRVKNNVGRNTDKPVRNAIRDWNRINGSFIRLTLVTRGRADININFKRNDSGIATPPRNGRPGPTIRIDPEVYRFESRRLRTENNNFSSNFSRAYRFVIRHELSHCLGFRHGNRSEGGRVLIPGTPRNNNFSVLDQPVSIVDIFRQSGRSFTNNDKKAIRKVYGGSARSNLCF